MTPNTEKARAAAATANTGNIPSGLGNRRNTTETTSARRRDEDANHLFKHIAIEVYEHGIECLCGFFIETRAPKSNMSPTLTRPLEVCPSCAFLRLSEYDMFPDTVPRARGENRG
ncbi:hypothetical protein OS128_04440 [Corynebacterium sp. P5848]|uniref:hypothetical protein n=1 Tax=Corynebacterium marambiense TaxID=2765364 RepID=UPI00226081F1|nr:hypothetical protein [Corynebacterium marambiense]MCX7542166.1 hypothetical protein [Corynebacterium marambiense]